MRRKYPVRIGVLMEELKVSDKSLSDGMKEIAIMGSWQQVVGKQIADYTTKLFIRDRKLHVHFSSAAARNELFYRRKEVLDKLNEKAGEKYITFISVF